MIFLNVGNKWSMSFLERIIQLNIKYQKNKIQVKELYGNPANSYLSGVRPVDRLPIFFHHKWENYIKKANDNNIEINYTFNASCLGNIHEFHTHLKTIQKEIYRLEQIGVKRFTIYSPYILEMLKIKHIEISTIHNNTNVNYIIGLSNLNKNIDKICLPIYMNRDFKRIRALDHYLHPKIDMELILNEFCVSNGNTCVYRQECYNIQSHNVNSIYPFDRCTYYRKKTPWLWLRAPVIIPQWLDLYHEYGIHHFKLTGRTHPPSSILTVLEWYMSKKCDASIEQLWGTGLPKQKLCNPVPLKVDELARTNFINNFITSPSECEAKSCDVCSRCEKYWRVLTNDKEKV